MAWSGSPRPGWPVTPGDGGSGPDRACVTALRTPGRMPPDLSGAPGALTCLAVEGRFLQARDMAGLRAEAARAAEQGAAAVFLSAGPRGDPIVLAAGLGPVVPGRAPGGPDQLGPRGASPGHARPGRDQPRPRLRGAQRAVLRPAVHRAAGRGGLPVPGAVAGRGGRQRRPALPGAGARQPRPAGGGAEPADRLRPDRRRRAADLRGRRSPTSCCDPLSDAPDVCRLEWM